MAGFSSSPIPKMGMLSCPLGELLFEDVDIPASHLVGTEGKGFALARNTSISAAAWWPSLPWASPGPPMTRR